jgi:hypothetical protein
MEHTGVQYDETARWLIMKRGSVLVVCNFAPASRPIPCPDVTDKKTVLCSKQGTDIREDTLFLPEETVAVLWG